MDVPSAAQSGGRRVRHAESDAAQQWPQRPARHPFPTEIDKLGAAFHPGCSTRSGTVTVFEPAASRTLRSTGAPTPSTTTVASPAFVASMATVAERSAAAFDAEVVVT